jgi:hypothetical protein
VARGDALAPQLPLPRPGLDPELRELRKRVRHERFEELLAEMTERWSDESLELIADEPQAHTAPPSERFDEVYLQLMLLDLDDEAALLSWVNEFGLLEINEQAISSLVQPGHDARYERLRYYPLGRCLGEPLRDQLWEEEDQRRRAAGFRGKARPGALYPTTLEEFRWAARCIRDLARSYWCISTDGDPASLRWDNPWIAGSFRASKEQDDRWTHLIPPDLEQGGWWTHDEMESFLLRTLEANLTGFSPRLIPDHRVIDPIPTVRGRERSSAVSGHFWDSGDLFAICCLELFNHIAEGAEYRTCANEACGRWFVRQQGRSAHDQRRRSGVKFCSYTCARQQTQRNYRRRGTPRAR